jgi:hypothetical protein
VPAPGISYSRSRQLLLQKQDGVSLLCLPTRTGTNYVSKTEEMQRAEQADHPKSSSKQPFRRRVIREGGLYVIVKVGMDNQLRARRCNYAEDSETTIWKRLQEAVQSWQQQERGN